MYIQPPAIQQCIQTVPDLYWIRTEAKKSRFIYATRYLPKGQIVIKCSKGAWKISR